MRLDFRDDAAFVVLKELAVPSLRSSEEFTERLVAEAERPVTGREAIAVAKQAHQALRGMLTLPRAGFDPHGFPRANRRHFRLAFDHHCLGHIGPHAHKRAVIHINGGRAARVTVEVFEGEPISGQGEIETLAIPVVPQRSHVRISVPRQRRQAHNPAPGQKIIDLFLGHGHFGMPGQHPAHFFHADLPFPSPPGRGLG